MNHIRLFKILVSTYMISAVLAFLLSSANGAYTHLIDEGSIGWFPLRFELALSLLALSLVSAYSLLFGSQHGRALLSLIAGAYLINSVLSTAIWHSSLAASVSSLNFILLGSLLYMAWSNPLPKKIRQLHHLATRKQHQTTPSTPEENTDD